MRYSVHFIHYTKFVVLSITSTNYSRSCLLDMVAVFWPDICFRFRYYSQGFSRVTTRPAGRVKGVSKSRGSGRVGSGQVKRFQNFAGRVESGRVGSRGFKMARVWLGRVKRFQNLAGRVRSGPVGSRGFQNLAVRVGS